MARYPYQYSGRQLRTLQRTARRRIIVARQLVYVSAEHNELDEADLRDIKPVSDNYSCKGLDSSSRLGNRISYTVTYRKGRISCTRLGTRNKRLLCSRGK